MGNINYRDVEMEVKSIHDVPNEIIQKFILVHLSSDDVRCFGKAGCIRFMLIANDVLEKRRK